MRFVLVPLILAALLAVGPTAVHANNNQASAEKIAANLGDRFPGYDIAVSYQNGKVRLVGQVSSPDMAKQVLDLVRKTSGVKVTEVESGLRVANMGAQPVVASQRVMPMPTNQPVPQVNSVTPPQAKRSILSPPKASQVVPPQVVQPQVPQAQIAAAPVPMPIRQQVVQVSAQEVVPPQVPQAQHLHNGQPISQQQLQMMQQQAMQQQMMQQQMQQQVMPQNAYHPEAYGPQGPMPGQYNHPNLPDYAWPSYACYPNYAEVSYPKQYSPKAWPYIGPFYPYPQVPLGWRKVTLEHHDGWWWLDFDDGTPSGPFSPLFRQPVRYTY